MKTKLLFAAILISFTGFAFAGSSTTELASDLRSTKSFSGVIINTSANVILTQGETNSVRVEGEKSTVKDISTEIENGSLVVSGNNSHAVTIYITVTDLSLVEVNGNAKVYANGLINSDILLLKVHGSGSIRMDVRTLTVGMIVKGNGKIIVSGSTGDSYSKVLGSGNIFADNLDSKRSEKFENTQQSDRANAVLQ